MRQISISLIILLIVSLSVSKAQGIYTKLSEVNDSEKNSTSTNLILDASFISKAPIPGKARYYGGSAAYGNYFVIVGGDTNGFGKADDAVLRYNVDTDVWDSLTAYPTNIRINQLVSVGDFLYSFGGYDSDTSLTSKSYKYSKSADTWETIGDLPLQSYFSKTVEYNDQYIYLIGGIDTANTILDTVLVYNISQDSYTPGTSLPFGRAEGACVLKGNNKIVYAGGFKNDSTGVIADTVIVGEINNANPNEISWSGIGKLVTGSLARHQAYDWRNDKIIIVGGSKSNGFDAQKKIVLFDLADSTSEIIDSVATGITAFHGGLYKDLIGKEDFNILISGGLVNNLTLSSASILYQDTLTVTRVNNTVNQRNNYKLSQNYPNPFNPTTTIEYSLPKAGNVKVIIFNALGEEIKTLVNEEQSVGLHSINFDGRNLSSGVYFYQLTSGDYKEVKKMVLMK